MQRHSELMPPLSTVGFWALVIGLLLVFPAKGTAEKGVPGASVVLKGDRKVGQTIAAHFDLKGYILPDGSYASINLKHLKRPDGRKPTVKTGYPDTLMTFYVPGAYTIRFILNEIRKPSCGGVEAKRLLETEVDLLIK